MILLCSSPICPSLVCANLWYDHLQWFFGCWTWSENKPTNCAWQVTELSVSATVLFQSHDGPSDWTTNRVSQAVGVKRKNPRLYRYGFCTWRQKDASYCAELWIIRCLNQLHQIYNFTPLPRNTKQYQDRPSIFYHGSSFLLVELPVTHSELARESETVSSHKCASTRWRRLAEAI